MVCLQIRGPTLNNPLATPLRELPANKSNVVKDKLPSILEQLRNPFSKSKNKIWPIFSFVLKLLACVASVSVKFRSKKKRGTGFSVLTMREMKREPFFAIFRAVFDSCSAFFTPKPHRNARYIGYEIISLGLRAYLRKQPTFHSNQQLVCLRSHVWGMTDDLLQPRSGLSASDWLKQISLVAWPLTIRSTTQIWVVEHHQDGMSARTCTVLKSPWILRKIWM